MAYVKKSVEESDADEAPIVSQETVEKKTKKSEDQSAEIAALKAQIEMLTKLISANAASTNASEYEHDRSYRAFSHKDDQHTFPCLR